VAEGGGRPAEASPVRAWRRAGPARSVVRDRWIHLRAEAWENGAGKTLDPWYVLDWPDWVHVLALTADDRVVLVRQWRPGLGAASLELPGGMAEPGDADPVAAGRRELLEETGYDAREMRELPALSPDPARMSNRLRFLLALGAERVAEQRLDPTEEIAVELHPVPHLLEALDRGAMANAAHAAGVLLGLRAAGRIRF
jgi:8-oxo-dGTP pyrophosphatase MutT (NUDIX family)